MNISSAISFFLAFSVLAFGLFYSADNVLIFFDGISVFIVVGGTISATAIAFRMERLIVLVKVFLIRIMKGNELEYGDVIISLIKISQVFAKDPDKAIQIASESKNYFLIEAMKMVNEGALKKHDIVRILRSRVESMHQHYMIDASKFKTIGKFPPAFGMMGTTIGMIVLLSNLGGADAAKSIGPAMAICLITTLYGVALANLVIVPIAENLVAKSKETKLKNTIVCEGVRLLMENKNTILLAEELNSFLLPSERVDWKKVIKK